VQSQNLEQEAQAQVNKETTLASLEMDGKKAVEYYGTSDEFDFSVCVTSFGLFS
jgi:hypothetical protein